MPCPRIRTNTVFVVTEHIGSHVWYCLLSVWNVAVGLSRVVASWIAGQGMADRFTAGSSLPLPVTVRGKRRYRQRSG